MPFPLIPLLMAGAPAVGRLLGGGAKGAAAERTNQNNYQQTANSQALQRYGTQQNALLQALLAQDRGALDRYGTQQAATTNAMQGQQAATSRALEAQSGEGLQRAQLGLQAPSIRAKQSLLGSLMQNLQPVNIQTNARVAASKPTITGGLSPAAIDPTTRQHGGALMQAALQAQLSGSDIPKATDFKSGIQDWKSSILTPPDAVDFGKGVLTPPELSGYRQPGKGESIMSGGSIIGGILGELLPLILNRGGGGAPGGTYPIDPVGGG